MIDDLTRNVLEQRDNIENQRNRELNSNREAYIKQLQQENKQLREKVNKFNIDKINNENKSLKGSCKILGEKNNNQRKELQILNNKIEKLKVINEEHKKLNGELREENQKYKEVIDKANKYIEKHLTDKGRFLMLNEWQVPDLLDILKDSDSNE